MAAERARSTRTPPRPQDAAEGAEGFRQRGRLPPLYVALLLFIVGLYLSPLVTGDAPADPSYWWLVPLVLIGGMTLPPAVWLYRCSASVRVAESGCWCATAWWCLRRTWARWRSSAETRRPGLR